MLRVCLKCGKTYEGRSDSTLCGDCTQKPANSVVRPRTCTVCGTKFMGYPRSKYCPECRIEHLRERKREYIARQKAGTTRKLGSIDRCEVCGKEYVVASGHQKYCPECAPEAIAEKIRARSREWNASNVDYIKRREDRQRATAYIKCVICGREFQPNSGAPITCSPECSALHHKKLVADFDAKNREKRNEYFRNREAAKIAAMSPDELREYRDKKNAKARENYKKRKEKKQKETKRKIT